MSASEDEVHVKVTGESASAQTAMRGAAAAVKDGVASMKSSISSIGEHFEKLKGGLLAISAVLAGGKIFKEAVNATREFTKESILLGRSLGVTATAASAYIIALDDIGSSGEEMANASRGLTRQLKTNEASLNSLGIVTRDSNGHLRQMSDIMTDAIATVNSYKEGTDRNLAAQTAFGRGVTANSALFKLNSAAIEEAKTKQEELGLVVGEENVQAYQDFRVATNDVHDVLKGLQKAIGDAVMPVLTQLGQWFADIGPAAVVVIKGAVGGLVAVFWGLYNVVAGVWSLIKGVFDSILILCSHVGTALAAIASGDFKGVVDAFDGMGEEMKETWGNSWDEIVANSTKARDKIANLFSNPTAVKGGAAEGRDFKAPPKQSGSDDRFREWSVALEKIKDVEGEFRQHDIAADIAYWQQKLALVTGGTARDKALREKLGHEILSLKRQQAVEEKQIEEEGIANRKAIGQTEIQNRQETLRYLREMGKISEEEELAGMRLLEQQKYEIELQALQERLKLVEADKLARIKVMNEIEQLQRQQANALQKIDDESAIARKKHIEDMLSPVVQAVDRSVKGMIQGTMTLNRAIGNLARSILAEFVQMSVKRFVSWVASEVAMTQASVVGAATRGAVSKEAHKQGLAMSAASAIKEIATSAYVTMANVYRTVSAIPYIGWILAPIAAGIAGAAVLAFGSSIPSARRGFDIPAGVNPLTQLHEKEMVLPAQQADAVRAMAAGGGSRLQLSTRTAGRNHVLVEKKDLAKLVKTLNNRFAFA